MHCGFKPRSLLRGGRAICLELALSGHAQCADECLLLGVKRTWRERVTMPANNPKRTLMDTCPS
jgi:hypothetical protein